MVGFKTGNAAAPPAAATPQVAPACLLFSHLTQSPGRAGRQLSQACLAAREAGKTSVLHFQLLF